MVSLARKWLHEMFLYFTKVQSSKDLAGKFSCVKSNPWGVKLHYNLLRLQNCGARLVPAEMHSDHLAFDQIFGRFFLPILAWFKSNMTNYRGTFQWQRCRSEVDDDRETLSYDEFQMSVRRISKGQLLRVQSTFRIPGSSRLLLLCGSVWGKNNCRWWP